MLSKVARSAAPRSSASVVNRARSMMLSWNRLNVRAITPISSGAVAGIATFRLPAVRAPMASTTSAKGREIERSTISVMMKPTTIATSAVSRMTRVVSVTSAMTSARSAAASSFRSLAAWDSLFSITMLCWRARASIVLPATR